MCVYVSKGLFVCLRTHYANMLAIPLPHPRPRDHARVATDGVRPSGIATHTLTLHGATTHVPGTTRGNGRGETVRHRDSYAYFARRAHPLIGAAQLRAILFA